MKSEVLKMQKKKKLHIQCLELTTRIQRYSEEFLVKRVNFRP